MTNDHEHAAPYEPHILENGEKSQAPFFVHPAAPQEPLAKSATELSAVNGMDKPGEKGLTPAGAAPNAAAGEPAVSWLDVNAGVRVVALSEWQKLRAECDRLAEERDNAFQCNQQLTDMVNSEREMREQAEHERDSILSPIIAHLWSDCEPEDRPADLVADLIQRHDYWQQKAEQPDARAGRGGGRGAGLRRDN